MISITSIIKRYPQATFWLIALGGARLPKSEAISTRASSVRWMKLHPPGGDGISISAWRSLSAIEKQQGGAIMSWKTYLRTVILTLALLAVAALERGEAVSAEQALPVYLRNEVAVKQA